MPADEQTAEVGLPAGSMKGHQGKVWMSQRSLPSACVCWSFRGLRALPVPITMPLEPTQACFVSGNPAVFLCPLLKNTPQSLLHNLSVRGGSAEDGRLIWLFCLGVPLFYCPSACNRVHPGSFAIWSLVTILCAICSSGVDISTAIDYIGSFQAHERLLGPQKMFPAHSNT